MAAVKVILSWYPCDSQKLKAATATAATGLNNSLSDAVLPITAAAAAVSGLPLL